MEGSFADAANNHGFKRSRWRRLWRQQIQDYLIAAIQNVRILIRHGGRRPIPASQELQTVHQTGRSSLWRLLSALFSALRPFRGRAKRFRVAVIGNDNYLGAMVPLCS